MPKVSTKAPRLRPTKEVSVMAWIEDPADTDVTEWIQNRANELLGPGNGGIRRIDFDSALKATTTHIEDFVTPYVEDLGNVVDPLGGAAAAYWQPLANRYGLDITVVQPKDRPDFRFHDVRSRRQNPDGLLKPLGYGRTERA